MTKGNVAFANAVGEETVVTNSYEALGQNVEQKSHAGFSLYAYHPDSPLRRLHVKKDGEATAFLWDPQTQNNLEDIEVGSGATRATHQHGTGMDQLVGTEGPAGTRGYVTDALGSVRVVTDPVGNVTGRYGYSAYGEPRGEQESEGNRFRFTGREWEPESGLQYTRQRYFAPAQGRWTQLDPAFPGVPGNPYGYVDNLPVSRTDPSGLGGQVLIFVPGLGEILIVGGAVIIVATGAKMAISSLCEYVNDRAQRACSVLYEKCKADAFLGSVTKITQKKDCTGKLVNVKEEVVTRRLHDDEKMEKCRKDRTSCESWKTAFISLRALLRPFCFPLGL